MVVARSRWLVAALLLLILAGLAQRPDGAARGASHSVGRPIATLGSSDVGDTGLASALRAAVTGRVRDGLTLQPPTLTVSGPPNSLRTVIIRMVNTGTTTWSGAYALVLVSGPPIGLPARLALPGVVPGEPLEAPVVVRLPSRVGRVVSATWAMRGAAGQPFGPLLRLVTRAVGATAVPTVMPLSQSTATIAATAPPTGTALRAPPTAPPPATDTATATQTASPTVQQPVGSPTSPPTLSPTPVASGPTATVTLTATSVAAMTQTTTPTVTPTEGAGSLITPTPLASAASTVVTAAPSPPPMAATPTMTRTAQAGLAGLAALPVMPAPSEGAQRWLFGGVALGDHNRVELALLNLGSRATHTWVTLVGSGGARIEAYLVVGPRRVRRVALNDLIGPDPAVAAEVRGDAPLVVERVTSHANDIDEGTAGAMASGHPASPSAAVGGVPAPLCGRTSVRPSAFTTPPREARAWGCCLCPRVRRRRGGRPHR